jgi:hypothetical protein
MPWPTLHIYVEARSTPDILDRLHQYARCIDGLILPDAGKSRWRCPIRNPINVHDSRESCRFSQVKPKNNIYLGTNSASANRFDSLSIINDLRQKCPATSA